MSEPDKGQAEPHGDWRTQRRAERRARRAGRAAPIGAIILVLVGVVLLAQTFGLVLPKNWWALFLLIPRSAPWLPRSGTIEAAATR